LKCSTKEGREWVKNRQGDKVLMQREVHFKLQRGEKGGEGNSEEARVVREGSWGWVMDVPFNHSAGEEKYRIGEDF